MNYAEAAKFAKMARQLAATASDEATRAVLIEIAHKYESIASDASDAPYPTGAR